MLRHAHFLLFLLLASFPAACGGSQRGSGTSTDRESSVVPCDEVELLARTDRPDRVQQELAYLQADYAGAPGEPTSHVQVRLRSGGDPAALARSVGASVRSVEGWHLFVFPSVDAAKRGVRELLCDPAVLEASVSLQHRTLR